MPKPAKGKTKSERLLNQMARHTPVAIRAARSGISLYSQKLCDEIVLRLGNGEETLSAICRDPEMPSWMTVHRWMEEYPEFAERIHRARDLARLRLEDEVLDIAEESNDPKVRIDTRFKMLDRADELERKQNKPKDPKLVEASKDEGGAWRVTDDGKRLNPISESIERFRRKRGMAPSES